MPSSRYTHDAQARRKQSGCCGLDDLHLADVGWSRIYFA
jgi:hypothetical protein